MGDELEVRNGCDCQGCLFLTFLFLLYREMKAHKFKAVGFCRPPKTEFRMTSGLGIILWNLRLCQKLNRLRAAGGVLSSGHP